MFQKALFRASLGVYLFIEAMLPSYAAQPTTSVPPQEALLRTLLDKGSDEKTFEHVLGNPEAPVVIVAYGSLSCGVCAEFHRHPVERLIEKYGKTNNICIILKDYVTDGPSARASLISWCVPEKSEELRKAFFAAQREWIQAEDSTIILKKIAGEHGVSPDTCDACLKNQDLLNDIVAFRQKEKELTGLTHVPLVFFVHRKTDEKGETTVKIENVLDANFEELDRLTRTSLGLPKS